jgi:hypothetical protein
MQVNCLSHFIIINTSYHYISQSHDQGYMHSTILTHAVVIEEEEATTCSKVFVNCCNT